MSLTGITSYLRPGTLEEALSLLGDRAIAVGGGTDVIRHPHTGVDTLVDLGELPLRYIRQDRGFAIGATATLTDMLEHPGLAPLCAQWRRLADDFDFDTLKQQLTRTDEARS